MLDQNICFSLALVTGLAVVLLRLRRSRPRLCSPSCARRPAPAPACRFPACLGSSRRVVASSAVLLLGRCVVLSGGALCLLSGALAAAFSSCLAWAAASSSSCGALRLPSRVVAAASSLCLGAPPGLVRLALLIVSWALNKKSKYPGGFFPRHIWSWRTS